MIAENLQMNLKMCFSVLAGIYAITALTPNNQWLTFLFSQHAFADEFQKYRIEAVLDVATIRQTNGLVGHVVGRINGDPRREIFNVHFDCPSEFGSIQITPCPVTIEKTIRSYSDTLDVSVSIIDQGKTHFLWTYTDAVLGMLSVSQEKPVSGILPERERYRSIDGYRSPSGGIKIYFPSQRLADELIKPVSTPIQAFSAIKGQIDESFVSLIKIE